MWQVHLFCSWQIAPRSHIHVELGWRHGGGGRGDLPPKGLQEGKIKETWGVFSSNKVIYSSIFVFFNKELSVMASMVV